MTSNKVNEKLCTFRLSAMKTLKRECENGSWFTYTKEKSLLMKKIQNIVDLVSTSSDIGVIWFENRLLTLMKKNEHDEINPPKRLLLTCQQNVDCLMEMLHSENSLHKLITITALLSSFAKIHPKFLLNHLKKIELFKLNQNKNIICNVIKIFESVLPLKDTWDSKFLNLLETTLLKMILVREGTVVVNCIHLISVILNKFIRKYKNAELCYKHYRNNLIKAECKESNFEQCDIQRSFFIYGLFLQHFDVEQFNDSVDKVYEKLIHFSETFSNKVFVMLAIGNFCIAHPKFMLDNILKNMYLDILRGDNNDLKVQVLKNLRQYLIEEATKKESPDVKIQNLKEADISNSELPSCIIQTYLNEILHCYLQSDQNFRLVTGAVIQLIANQALVHPSQIIPYLVAMCRDNFESNSKAAKEQLLLMQTKCLNILRGSGFSGIKLSYQLQNIINKKSGNVEIVRGYYVKNKLFYAVNSDLYLALSASREGRRGLILAILKEFSGDNSVNELPFLLFLADNLAYFAYKTQDEPLFVLYHIERAIASGAEILQAFQKQLFQTNCDEVEENETVIFDDIDDECVLLKKLPGDISQLQDIIKKAEGCLLLLQLKNTIQCTYSLNDSKIQQYSPSDTTFSKIIKHKIIMKFNPKDTIEIIKTHIDNDHLDKSNHDSRRSLIKKYLKFKQLLLKLDLHDDDSDRSDNENSHCIQKIVSEDGQSDSTSETIRKPLHPRQKLNRIAEYQEILEKRQKFKKRKVSKTQHFSDKADSNDSD